MRQYLYGLAFVSGLVTATPAASVGQMPRPVTLVVIRTTDSTASFQACADKNPAADGIAWRSFAQHGDTLGWTGLTGRAADVIVLGTRPCLTVVAKNTGNWAKVNFGIEARSVRSGAVRSQFRFAVTPEFVRPIGLPGPITIDTMFLSMTGPMPGTLLVGCRWCGNQPKVRLTVEGIFRPRTTTVAEPQSIFYDAAGCAQFTVNAGLSWETWPHSLGLMMGAPRDETVTSPPWLHVACRVETLDAQGVVIASATSGERGVHLLGDAAYALDGATQGFSHRLAMP